MKKTLFAILFLLSAFYTGSKGNTLPASKDKPEYSVKNVHEELLDKAIAVVRKENYTLEIESKYKSYYKGFVATTILTSKADYLCYKSLYYGKFRKIKNFSGALYDKNGKLIQKLKKTDISDESAAGNGTLYSDSRVQYAGFESQDYPFTVEFEYEIEREGSLHYPLNIFQESADISVEKSTFDLISPIGHEVRIKEYNLNSPAQKKEIEGKYYYHWEENNLSVYKREPFSPPYYEVMPVIFLAPTDFVMEDLEGNMESWESLGKWQYKLNEGRQSLPEETATLIKELTKEYDTPIEKVKAVYNYLQQNTRYISIQVGIGGWQPFEASVVDKYKYGDCKALVNYMRALLNVIDIESYYTLVNAGSDAIPLIKEFPSRQFNHIILCVPIKQDTIWLECTSQSAPFGYLGDFTGNREVLLITPEGGKIAHTATYSANENELNRKANIEIHTSGDATAKVTAKYKGLQYETINYIAGRDIDTQKKTLYRRIDIPSFKIEKFDFNIIKKTIPIGEENIDLHLSKYATVSGKRIFFIPNIMNRNTYIPKKLQERKNDMVIKTAYHDYDSLVFKIPEGYEIEYLPENISIKNKFGSYNVEIKSNNDEIVYIRNHTMKNGRFTKEDYILFREYLIDIVNYDKKKVILSKKV